MSAQERRVRAGRRVVTVRRPDKVLFPDDGHTKGDLAEYHRQAAPLMVPHLRGRPLMMQRFPDGVGAQGVTQQSAPRHFPDWVGRIEVPKRGGTVVHPVCDDAATLVYLADQACVTVHRWLSRGDRPDHPDRLVLDLDPPEEADFADVRWAAHRVCRLLDELRLPLRLMTTGSKGLHVVVALDRRATSEEVRGFATDVADLLAARHPDRLTTEQRKRDRAGRLYLDVQRNAYAHTAVAPYSVRPLPGAPVALPITRDELDDPELAPRRWTITSAPDRFDRDPWSPSPRPRSLTTARRLLAEARQD